MSWFSNMTGWFADTMKTVTGSLKDGVDNFTGRAAREDAKEAQRRELRYWYLQQEYNTPANQVARLREAGLNPNLAYNNVTTGNASSAPDTVQMSAEDSGLSKILGLCTQAIGLINAKRAADLQETYQMAQMEHSKDVLDFQKQQFAVNSAFRQMELSNGSRRWQTQFDETVRHNKAMENAPKGGLYGLLERTLSGFFGKSVTDVATDTGNWFRELPSEIDSYWFRELPSEIDSSGSSGNIEVGKLWKPILYHFWKGLQDYGRSQRYR